jgi:hypothetical protein
MIGLLFTKNSDSTIALFLSTEPILVRIAGLGDQIGFDLFLQGICLLNTDNIGVSLLQPFQKPFFEGRTDAIDIVRNYFHVLDLRTTKLNNPVYLLSLSF